MAQNWTVLVPVEVLEGESIPDALGDLLRTVDVVVLGYHVLPEQTPPGQARLQFEDRAQKRLDDVTSAFEKAGGTVETRLVFTHDEDQTIDRIAEETGSDAVLLSNPASEVERLLVPLRGAVDPERITAFVVALVGGRDIHVTLLSITDSEEGTDDGTTMAEEAATRLREGGIPEAAIETEVTESASPVTAITTAAEDHDVVVMGEPEPSLWSALLGEEDERVATQSIGPVLVVRRDRSEMDQPE